MHTIVTIGEILVEFVSHMPNCALATVGTFSGPYPSGAPAIFADQAARMGARTEMIGGVGDDGFGRIVRERLSRDGVGAGGVTVSPGLSTGVAFVSYYDTGDRDFIFHLTGTAADRFAVPSGLIDPAQTFLHVSASSLGNSAMRGMILTTMRAVSEAGGAISVDPNARPELLRDDIARAALFECVERATCLMPSTSDLAYLYPDLSEPAAIDRLLAARAEIIVIKYGADGASVVSGDARHDFAGHAVDEIDPTGAGDCFGGTFVSLIAQGRSLEEAGRLANAAGALAVTRRGPMEGNSGPTEIAEFLATLEDRNPA